MAQSVAQMARAKKGTEESVAKMAQVADGGRRVAGGGWAAGKM